MAATRSTSLLLVAPPEAFTPQRLARFIALLRAHPATSPNEAINRRELHDLAASKEGPLANGPLAYWEWGAAGGRTAVFWDATWRQARLPTTLKPDGLTVHELPYRDGLDCRHAFVGREGTRHQAPLPAHDPAVQEQVHGLFVQAIDLYEPEFALIDDWGRHVQPRQGEDPRRHGWGLLAFGPRLVAEAGKANLLAVPAHAVRETSWGGILLQTGHDPLQPTPQERRKVTAALKPLFEPFKGKQTPPARRPDAARQAAAAQRAFDEAYRKLSAANRKKKLP